MRTPRLLDEQGRPGLRVVWGGLLARAASADVAVTRVRLATLDFGDRELARVSRVRVLLAELSAATLEAEAHAVCNRPDAARAVARLLALLGEGRLDVRSAPLGGWSPDFSVFHDPSGPRVALVGPHRFEPPGALRGPLLVSRHGRPGARRVARRFQALWARGHDVRGPVGDILAQACERAADAGRSTPRALVPQGFSRSGRSRVVP